MTVRKSDLLLALAWLAFDQLTKIWAATGLDDRSVLVIDGIFAFSLSHNTGALFGIMADWSAPARWLLLILLPSAATALIAVMMVKTPREQRVARAGLALIVGGAAGNLLDRIVRGHVIDFIDVHCAIDPVKTWLVDRFGTYHWPTFNVADVGLTCGAALLVIHLFRQPAGDDRAPRSD